MGTWVVYATLSPLICSEAPRRRTAAGFLTRSRAGSAALRVVRRFNSPAGGCTMLAIPAREPKPSSFAVKLIPSSVKVPSQMAVPVNH